MNRVALGKGLALVMGSSLRMGLALGKRLALLKHMGRGIAAPGVSRYRFRCNPSSTRLENTKFFVDPARNIQPARILSRLEHDAQQVAPGRGRLTGSGVT